VVLLGVLYAISVSWLGFSNWRWRSLSLSLFLNWVSLHYSTADGSSATICALSFFNASVSVFPTGSCDFFPDGSNNKPDKNGSNKKPDKE